jgi:hypothetical protein
MRLPPNSSPIGTTKARRRSASWQPAVSPTGSRRNVKTSEAFESPSPQVANLRPSGQNCPRYEPGNGTVFESTMRMKPRPKEFPDPCPERVCPFVVFMNDRYNIQPTMNQ